MTRALDRYVFVEFWKIFVTTALGFPILVNIIDLTDNLDKYLGQKLSPARIALSYLYWLPDSMFMVLPAAVLLFATVFAIGLADPAFRDYGGEGVGDASIASSPRFSRARSSRRCSGWCSASWRRLPTKSGWKSCRATRPISATTDTISRTRRTGARLQDRRAAFTRRIHRRDGDRAKRKGPAYPSYVLSANAARYNPKRGWIMKAGALHVIPDTVHNLTFSFDSLVDKHFTEPPKQLTLAQKAPTDMGFRELGRFIESMERSGAEVNELRVERMLKIAIPVTCIVIYYSARRCASTQRGGAACEWDLVWRRR
jgi:lipopolysaccharide export system permease protein